MRGIFIDVNLISPSYGASGRLYFMVVAFPGYLHLYHYKNMPIQMYRKFHLQKLKIFR